MTCVSFALPNGLELGGVTVWSVNLARSLAASGYAVHILEHFVEAERGQDHGKPALVPVDVSRLQLQGAPFALNKEEMTRFSQVYGRTLPGIIVPNYSTGTYATCALLTRHHAQRMRVIGFAHTDEQEYYDHLAFYAPIIHRFVAVSEEIRDRLATRISRRADDIIVRPYGVHIPPALVHQYSAATEPMRLLYAGRMVERQKRISDLLRLIEELGRRKVDFMLNIAGEGEDAPSFMERLAAFAPDLRQRVAWLGRLPHAEMETLWNTSDVCVLTSDYEGCSIAMLEAMAHGCVPVVTAVSGTRMFIQQDQTGVTVPVGDMAAMATAIAALARQRERLPEMGRRARAVVAQRCAYPDYVDWFIEMSQAVWEQPARAWPRYRPLFRPTFQELLTRSSKFVQVHHPRLYGFYQQVNYHVRRVSRQEVAS